MKTIVNAFEWGFGCTVGFVAGYFVIGAVLSLFPVPAKHD